MQMKLNPKEAGVMYAALLTLGEQICKNMNQYSNNEDILHFLKLRQDEVNALITKFGTSFLK